MNPFNCSGTSIPKMFGRQRILEKILSMLNKPIPDNVSVVAPKLYGKTVLLNNLCERLRQTEGFYTSVYIDLRHKTPQSDVEFRRTLANHLSESFNGLNKEYSKLLRDCDDTSISDNINIVLADLNENNKRLVIIFDAFDSLTLGTLISPNLLDQLRSFATDNPSLSLVIGSRLRLRELCKTEESRTSDFWRIFAEPIQLGALEEQDYDEFWKPFEMRSITVEKGARTDFITKTGGVPVIVTGLLKPLFGEFPDGAKISQVDVSAFADRFQRDQIDVLNDLWEIRQQLQDIVIDATTGEASTASFQAADIEECVTRGLIKKNGGKISSNCMILAKFSESKSTTVHEINRLFGKKAGYEANIKRLLELRLNQVDKCGSDLTKYVSHAISDIDDGPIRVLNNARTIAEEALKIICTTEAIAAGEPLREDWLIKLQAQGIIEERNKIFPADRGQQVMILSWICGCDRKFQMKLTSKVSKQTFYVLRSLNEFGNYVTHRGAEEPAMNVAILMCQTAIELVESLSNDLVQR